MFERCSSAPCLADAGKNETKQITKQKDGKRLECPVLIVNPASNSLTGAHVLAFWCHLILNQQQLGETSHKLPQQPVHHKNMHKRSINSISNPFMGHHCTTRHVIYQRYRETDNKSCIHTYVHAAKLAWSIETSAVYLLHACVDSRKSCLIVVQACNSVATVNPYLQTVVKNA